MRPSVIVTINNDDNNYTYDVEIPTDVPCDKVFRDLINSLSVYSGVSDGLRYKTGLYSLRLQRFLDNSETFGTAGIWNGDVIMIR